MSYLVSTNLTSALSSWLLQRCDTYLVSTYYLVGNIPKVGYLLVHRYLVGNIPKVGYLLVHRYLVGYVASKYLPSSYPKGKYTYLVSKYLVKLQHFV